MGFTDTEVQEAQSFTSQFIKYGVRLLKTNRIEVKKAKKNDCIIFDEGYRGLPTFFILKPHQ